MKVLFSSDLTILVNEVGRCVKVDVLAYLHKHILLDPVKFSPESAHRVCQILYELASQLAINLT